MNIKKKLFMIFVVVLVIWVLLTAFFYIQHQVYVESYDIGEYIEFEEFGIFVYNIEKYNYENRAFNYPDYLLQLGLPGKFNEAIMNVCYFYSFPYEIDKANPKFDINCEIIVDGEYGISVDVRELLEDKLDFQYIGTSSESIIYLAETSITASSNQNIIQLTYSKDWDDALSEGISIVDLVDDKEYEVDFNLPFTKVRYDYFNRRSGYMQDYTNTIISGLLHSYEKGDTSSAESYISTEYIESFSWDILDKYCQFSPEEFVFSYVGQHKESDGVFMMKAGGYIEGESIDELTFYMIFDNSRWQIIDIDV